MIAPFLKASAQWPAVKTKSVATKEAPQSHPEEPMMDVKNGYSPIVAVDPSIISGSALVELRAAFFLALFRKEANFDIFTQEFQIIFLGSRQSSQLVILEVVDASIARTVDDFGAGKTNHACNTSSLNKFMALHSLFSVLNDTLVMKNFVSRAEFTATSHVKIKRRSNKCPIFHSQLNI